MRFARTVTGVIGAAIATAGCVQVDYGIKLEENLSGTSDLEMTVDLDRVAYAAAAVQAAFTNEGGPPTAEQVEEARDDLLAEIEEDRDDFDEANLRADIEEDLPDGVRVRYARQERDDLRQSLELGFAFDHVDRLREMRVGDRDDGDLDLGFEDSAPFEGLEIVEDGDEIIVRNEPIDPIEDVSSDGMLAKEIVEGLLKDLRVTFRLETPFRVLEHNATRVEGKTLIWVFDYDRLTSEEPGGIYARFRR
jgi:hypothetical protein